MKKYIFCFLLFFMMFTMSVNASEINEADFYLTRIGIDSSVYNGSEYNGRYNVYTEWFNKTDNIKMNDGDRFEKNKEYNYYIKLETLGDYTFSNDFVLNFKNKESDFYVGVGESKNDLKSYQTVVFYNTKYEKNKIYDDFWYYINPLKIGESPYINNSSFTSAYNSSISWFNVTDNKEMSSNDFFEEGKIYDVTYKAIPLGRRKFSKYNNLQASGVMNSPYYVGEMSSYKEEDGYEVTHRYDTNKKEGIIYGPFEINLSGCEPNKKIVYASSDDKRYDLVQSWKLITDDGEVELSSDDIFEEDKKYVYTVNVVPRDGYVLAKETTLSIITNGNGYFYGENFRTYSNFGTAEFNTNKKEISNISGINDYDININIGSNAKKISLYDNSNVIIESQKWYNVTDGKIMSEEDIFEEGKRYEYNLKLLPNKGYIFSSEINNILTSFLNTSFNVPSMNTTDISTNYISLKYVYDMVKKDDVIYDPIKIDNVGPVIGQSPDISTIERDKYYIGQTWYDATDEEYMTEDDLFEEGKMYYYHLSIFVKEGYSVNDNNFVKLDTSLEDNPYFKEIGGSGIGINDFTTTYIFDTGYSYENCEYIPVDLNSFDINYMPDYLNLDEYYNYSYQQQWYKNGKVMDGNDLFEKNNVYEYKLKILPIKGENRACFNVDYFKNNLYVSDINKNENDKYSELVIKYDTSIPEEKIIGPIEVNLESAKYGEQAILPVIDDSRLEITQGIYKSYDYYPFIRKFEGIYDKEEYHYEISVKPKEGYYLSNDFYVDIKRDTDSWSDWSGYARYYGNEYWSNMTFDLSEMSQELPLNNKKSPSVSFSDNEYLGTNKHDYSYRYLNIPYDIDSTNVSFTVDFDGDYDINYDRKSCGYMDYTLEGNTLSFTGLKDLDYSRCSVNFSGRETDNYYSLYSSLYIYPTRNISISPALTDYEGYYDGKKHTVSVGSSEGGEVLYSVDGLEWSSDIPKFSEIGTYQVYARVESDYDHFNSYPTSAFVTIKEDDREDNDIKISSNELTYNGDYQKLVNVSKNDLVYYSINEELNSDNYTEGSTEIPLGKDALEYTVYYYVPGNDNIKDLKGSVKATINKASVINPSINNYTGYYDGISHTITVSGGEGGTVEYSTDGSNWSDVLPSRVNIGTTCVYVRVNPDENHKEIDYAFGKIIIKNVGSDLEISDAIYEVTTPVIGKGVYVYPVSDGKYTIYSQWYNKTDDKTVDGNIARDKEYVLNIKVIPNDGYILDNDFKLNLENYNKSDFYVKTDLVNSNNYLYETNITYKTEVLDGYIYNVDDYFGVQGVKIGQRPYYNNVTYNKVIYNDVWYNLSDNRVMSENDFFETGKKYEYRVTLNPKNGYKFSKFVSVNFMENVGSPYFISSSYESSESKYVKVYSFDTNEEEGVIYGPIHIDLSSADVGGKPVYVKNYDVRYSLRQEWQEIDNNYNIVKTLSNEDVFERNKKYRYNIEVIPNDGYVSAKMIDFDFSGTENLGYFENSSSYYNYSSIVMDTHDKVINNIMLSNTNIGPSVGGEALYASIYDYYKNDYYIESQTWYNVDDDKKLVNGDKFKSGKTYEYTLKIKCKKGRIFNVVRSDLEGLVYNDYYVSHEVNSDENTYEIKIVFTLDKKDNLIYDNDFKIFDITPVIGEKVKYLTSSSNKYTLTQTWHNDTDDIVMNENDVFEKDKMYSYSFELTARDGYQFSNNFTGNINILENSEYYYALSFGSGSEDRMHFGFTYITSELDSNDIYGDLHLDLAIPAIGNKVKYLNNAPYLYKDESTFDEFDIQQAWVSDDNVLRADDVFENGRIYEYKIKLYPKGDYQIAKGAIRLNNEQIDNSEYFVSKIINYYDDSFEISYRFDMSKDTSHYIQNIDFSSFKVPVASGRVNYLNIQDDRFDVKEVWNTGYPAYTDLKDGDIFEDGKYYNYNVEIIPRNGYMISPNLNINNSLLNGYYSPDGTYFISGYFNALTKPTRNIELMPDEQLDGNTINVTDENTIRLSLVSSEGIDVSSYCSFGDCVSNLDVSISGNDVVISGLKSLDYNSSYFVNLYSLETDEYAYSYLSLNVKKSKAIAYNPIVKDYEGYYDGNNHSIEVNGDVYGQLLYSSDGINWSDKLITFKDVGSYKVYVKVLPDKDHLAVYPTVANVIIKEDKRIDNDIVISANDLIYNEKEQQLVSVNREDTVYYSLEKELNSTNYNEGSTTIPSVVNAGEYTVYYYIPSNETYKELLGNVSVTVKKVNTAPSVTNYLGIYDGNEHTITVNSGVQVEYSLDKNTWTDALPTRTEIGETIIYVRTKESMNYEASEIVQAKIIIRDPDSIQREDYNEDGIIDLLDVKQLFRIYMVTVDRENKEFVSKHDINGDGIVDLLDVKQFFRLVMLGTYD